MLHFSTSLLLPLVAASQPAKLPIPYAEVKPIVEMLRADLLPPDLARQPPAGLEAIWPEWISRRNAAIRARVQAGDEDSIVHFLLFGTTFTQRPRATDRELAALVTTPAEAMGALAPRIEDFMTGVAAPGTNERLQFARDVLVRSGLDPASDRPRVRQYLEERMRTASSSGVLRSSTLLDADAALVDRLTLFRDRGLSSDTSIFIDHGVNEALAAIAAQGVLKAGSVKRVAIIGPGLDFTDKLEGYDFYPQQTIQPFAVLDSLARQGLAAAAGVQVTAFDLSPRVIAHLDAARRRARAGQPYVLVLPRNADRPWSPALVGYWKILGDRIGEAAKGAAPPGAGRVEVRRVLVRAPKVLSVTARDVNIVAERMEPAPDERFDLVLATNILLYYDVFEQSLAATNIARMLRPGGLFLTNNRVFELPSIPLGGVGYTDVTYMSLAGIGDTGDRIIWYQRP